MKRLMYSLLIASMALGFNTHSRAEDKAKDELEDRVHTVNALADKRGGMKEAFHDISVETGVSVEELQRMHNRHSDVGPAGILIACVLADNTKKPPEQFLSKHVNGKGWGAIARDNGVPLEKINERLDHLERELGGRK
jgi:hypothetical protein